MSAKVVYHPWDYSNADRSWNGLLELIDDLARVPCLTEDECDAYVIVSSARLGDRAATHDLPVAPIRALTEKETATLVLMSVGIDNKEIAVRLGIGVESVKSRVRQIIRKLSAHDRTHAVAIGLRRGLIE